VYILTIVTAYIFGGATKGYSKFRKKLKERKKSKEEYVTKDRKERKLDYYIVDFDKFAC